MKRIIFTLTTVFVLAIMAGSANAQDKFAPYPGGTYHYTLPITIAHVSDATLTATGLTSGTSTISNISPSLTNIAITETSISFDVTYSNDATGTCVIAFEITDATTNCSNNIHLDVPMHALPTINLGITATTLACQALVASPASNVAASVPAGAETLVNTITFTVTPTVDQITDYSYDYTLTIPTDDQTGLTNYTLSYSGPGTYTEGSGSVTVTGIDETTDANGVFTITFVTTTGIANQTITGTLSAATMTDPVNSGSYTATLSPNPASSTVNSVPGIGTFN